MRDPESGILKSNDMATVIKYRTKLISCINKI